MVFPQFNATEGFFEWASNNPITATAYGVAAIGAGVAIAAPAAIAGPALAVAGFGADGIVKASIASGVQAGIGNVAAGSAFATLQSAGMAGYGAAIVNGVVQAGGAGAALASGGAAALKAKLCGLPKPNPYANLMEDFWSCWEAKQVLEDDGVKGETSHSIREATSMWWSLDPEFSEDIVEKVMKSIPARSRALLGNLGGGVLY
ncbi:hypothetical protein GGR54DRAFT_241830 [Hypoxylon sp. NC1633]|nr:hypothetical protein GGR54DRAFT_241830 [Hypoxylon sp. NC1633]